MKNYFIEYKFSNDVNYRIYHSEIKEFKVSRNVIFNKREFFNAKHVAKYNDEILSFVEDDINQKTKYEFEEE